MFNNTVQFLPILSSDLEVKIYFFKKIWIFLKMVLGQKYIYLLIWKFGLGANSTWKLAVVQNCLKNLQAGMWPQEKRYCVCVNKITGVLVCNSCVIGEPSLQVKHSTGGLVNSQPIWKVTKSETSSQARLCFLNARKQSCSPWGEDKTSMLSTTARMLVFFSRKRNYPILSFSSTVLSLCL